ncbi:hypothetical protein P171DRAFT_443626 [Karstenula rhodostoma CBS 690.94]|uniref:Ubiquitin 3 binding protein But2 C-terminal domain-containing protein n=1 Tax=Karstenula rhodostoma CBS 690.94 TaxID=1392251 RepID=A0A9P4UCR0_9PLEO|nr:hypothetical protein P171DRAFT_443626 [Karstenula rhodostoma CBS 690.94]
MATKLFAFTSLLALAAARPTVTSRSADRSDCWQTNPGTVFYSCSNGYTGCFYQDPCSLPPLPSSAPPTPLPTTTSEAPEKHELTTPRSYNIYPLSTAQHNVQDKVPHVDLNKPAGSATTTTNALVFDNVPAGAKNCILNWRSTAPTDENNFTVNGSGQAWTRQLTGFPAKTDIVSFDGLKPFQDPAAEWTPSLDFTGWTESPGSHAGSKLECGEQVAVELKGSGEGEGENRVFITLTKTNGFFLTYEL